jgi:hypothetical protein
MKWLHCDEWYCWCSMQGDTKPDLAKYYPDHYARVPNELAERFERAIAEFRAIQVEVEAYAGKDKE